MTPRRLERVLRSDYDRVISLVEAGSRVLDLGCGNGELLLRLVREKSVRGSGVEIDEDAVIECIHKGLSVFQGDIDEGLQDYADASYDTVILNQTLQVIRRPDYVIEEMLRVGKKVIVSFPNFAHWRVRLQFLWTGRMPRTPRLPFHWFDTPNIHLLTIKDFVDFCRQRQIRILRSLYTMPWLKRDLRLPWLANALAGEAIFTISRSQIR
jgi:methionine biosynthesis protein MetW